MQYSLITAALVSAATVSALPSTLKPRQFDPAGNMHVLFGDDKINIGTVSPTDMLNTIYDNCYDEGICNANSWTVDTHVVGDADHDEQTVVTLSAIEGQYESWVKNGLIEAVLAAAAAEGVASSSDQEIDTSVCYTIGCQRTTDTITTWEFPSSVGVVFDNADGGVPSVINIGIALADPASNGFCSTFTTIGGAVAGAVNGVAGGIFSLLGLACGSG